MARPKRKSRETGKRGRRGASSLAEIRLGTEKRFVLQKLLGSGGMCEVYSALDLQRLSWSDRTPQVALKRLLPEFAANSEARLALVQEFFTLRNLFYEHVVRVYDLHEEDWGPCFTMEILEGMTLYQRQGEVHGGFGKKGIQIAADLFGSIAYLHSHGVIHGDIKPSNIFLAPRQRTVLFDFSVSRVEAQAGKATTAAAKGLRKALEIHAHSELHASPERIASGFPSFADDIFSACCTVYECIEGRHPFKRHSAKEAMELGLAPERPEHLGLRQWHFLSRGLSFQPANRPDAETLYRIFAGSVFFPRLFSRFKAV